MNINTFKSLVAERKNLRFLLSLQDPKQWERLQPIAATIIPHLSKSQIEAAQARIDEITKILN